MDAPGSWSRNVEDRRNDPRGATRFVPPGPRAGDLTFRPPLRTTLPRDAPQTMRYVDPEADFNNLSPRDKILWQLLMEKELRTGSSERLR